MFLTSRLVLDVERRPVVESTVDRAHDGGDGGYEEGEVEGLEEERARSGDKGHTEEVCLYHIFDVRCFRQDAS